MYGERQSERERKRKERGVMRKRDGEREGEREGGRGRPCAVVVNAIQRVKNQTEYPSLHYFPF